MTRFELLEKIKIRRKELGITVENLAILSQVGAKTIMRFFSGDDVKLSTVEKLTSVLGLDFAGNEIIDTKTLKEKRAKQKAIYIVSLTQDTSALEMQGLEDDYIQKLIEETKQEFLNGQYKKNLWAS